MRIRAFERNLRDGRVREQGKRVLVLPPLGAERLLPFDVGLDAVAVADVHRGRALQVLRRPFERYAASGEINTKLASMQDVPKKLAAIEARYADATIARMDGVSVDYPDWHFNVRPSNTEPLLRLNLEAASPEMMERKRDEVLELIRG